VAFGRILNRAVLARLSNALGIEGVKQFPAVLDMSDIKATLNISPDLMAVPPMASVFSNRLNNSGNFPAGATFDVGVNLIGASAVASFLPPTTGGNIPNASGSESRVLGISVGVGYVAAGAAADAALGGVNLIVLIALKNLATNVLSFIVIDEFAVVENVPPYSFSWVFPQGSRFKNAGAQLQTREGGGWDGYVPPNHDCFLVLSRTPGTGFFPNLTSMDTTFIVAQRPFRGDWKA